MTKSINRDPFEIHSRVGNDVEEISCINDLFTRLYILINTGFVNWVLSHQIYDSIRGIVRHVKFQDASNVILIKGS